jgi:hypothetical protein
MDDEKTSSEASAAAPHAEPVELNEQAIGRARAAWLRAAVGFPEADVERAAKAGGAAFRVVCRDGARLTYTSEINPDRLNVHVENGVVTKAFCG